MSEKPKLVSVPLTDEEVAEHSGGLAGTPEEQVAIENTKANIGKSLAAGSISIAQFEDGEVALDKVTWLVEPINPGPDPDDAA